MNGNLHKKIFISHSSKDKQIVDFFVDKVLHLGLQIDPNDVAYTSREETGVGTGEDIRKFIKENISTCDFVFFMISENYKKSEICLNEMGAAWATDRCVVPLIFPDLSFDTIGWLYNVRKGLLINDSDSLDSIFDDITEKYKYKQRVNIWNRNKNEFISFINALKSQSLLPVHIVPDSTNNNDEIIVVDAEEVEDLDIFDIREHFDLKCKELTILINTLASRQKEFNAKVPKHVEYLNIVTPTNNTKKIRAAIKVVADDMNNLATIYDEYAPKLVNIFSDMIDWGIKLQQYDIGDNGQIKSGNRDGLHSLVTEVLNGKNTLINGRNELTKIVGIEKHQKRAQRHLAESYTKIIEAFEQCLIKANEMAKA